MKVNPLLETYQQQLSDYCLNKCEINCCDSNIIPLSFENTEEMKSVFGEEIPWNRIEYWMGEILLYTGGVCPRHNPANKKCTLFNQSRPKVCDNFPLVGYLTDQNQITIRSACHFSQSKEFAALQRLGKEQGIEIKVQDDL